MKMTLRRLATSYLIILLLPLLAACNMKEEMEDIDTPPSADTEEEEAPYVEVTDSTFTAPDAYADHICEVNDRPQMQKWSNIQTAVLNTVINTRMPKLKAFFQQESQTAGRADAPWHVASLAFNYKSLSAKGEEIILSGRVTFPKYVNPALSHKLTSLSIVSHTYEPKNDKRYPSDREDLLTPRVLYNSAVIEPDYEGYGTTDERMFCFLSNKAMAQQMADCVEAALELLKRHHVVLADDGYSTCWGISMGAPGALAFTRHYETKASDSFKRAVRLHSTFASSGPLSTDQILEYYNQHDDHRGLLFHLQMAGLAAIDPERLEGYTPKDFIPEWMLTTQYEVEGATYTYYDLWMQNKPFTYVIILGNYQMLLWQLADVLASDMMDEEGHLLDASPKVQVLRKILAEENDWDSWTPQTPTYLTNHPKDGGVPYEPAHQLYLSFASRGGNVFWKDDTLPNIMEGDPMLVHFYIAYFEIMRAISCEFPSEMSTTLQSIN